MPSLVMVSRAGVVRNELLDPGWIRETEGVDALIVVASNECRCPLLR